MSSSGKKKTTMAKLARESRLRERRLEKQARKDARRLRSTEDHAPPLGDASVSASDRGESDRIDAEQATPASGLQAPDA